MVAHSAIVGAAFWFMVKDLPGLLQSVGYVSGVLWASWIFEHVGGRCEDDGE